jgi:hypothetical protein
VEAVAGDHWNSPPSITEIPHPAVVGELNLSANTYGPSDARIR